MHPFGTKLPDQHLARFVRQAIRIRPWRFVLAALGVSLSALLVLTIAAAYRSATLSITGYIGQPGVDIWVAPRGTDNLVRSSSLLSLDHRDALLRMPGVHAVDPIVVGFLSLKRLPAAGMPDLPITCIGIGYQSPHGLGGPPRIIAGQPPKGFLEITLDRAAAKRLHVVVGDYVTINGHQRKVSGLTDGTNLAISYFLFANFDAAALASGFVDSASFLLVRAQPGSDIPALIRAMRKANPDIEVFSRSTFLENCRREVASGYLPMLTLVYVLGVSAAAALTALLVHALTEEQRSELAVLLALGVPEWRLWFAVGSQGLSLALSGASLGIGLAYVLGLLLDRFYPVFPVSFGLYDAAQLIIIFTLASLVAASSPILNLRGLDPLEAFRP